MFKSDPKLCPDPGPSWLERTRNFKPEPSSSSVLRSVTTKPQIKRTTTLTFSVIFVIFNAFLFLPVNSGLVLNEFIQHFEPAHFSLEALAISHRVAKRSIESSKNSLYQVPVRFNITAHNRIFLISLRNSAQDIFSDDVIFENTLGPISFNSHKVYSGFLEDNPDSAVHGLITEDGHFDGHISTPTDDYYIEPAHRYFPNGSQAFHSVIYKSSDVLHPSKSSPCVSHELHLKTREEKSRQLHRDKCESRRFESFSSNGSSRDPSLPHPLSKRQADREKISDQVFEAVPPEDMVMSGTSSAESADGRTPHLARQTVTTYEVLDWDDVPESVRHHFRKRGKTPASSVIDVKKRTCMLYLQADHLFYENMGSEEACIEAMTRHVQRVNSIYNPIDFDQDGVPDNISFMIKRIKVHTSEALKDPTYRFPGNYGVEKFLELFSEENYDAFCLAYMFTYRDFEGGTLGLAWTGDLKNAGGVCERNGHYRGSLKSLNTGIITFLNYGKHVPPAVSHVTMAHEMGHNFGSPHDPENNKACVPGGDDGNYIMFARATSGDKKNNRNFSPCSLKAIRPVLLAKARGPKGCFKEPQTALCGNGVVEEGEECDCGWAEDCTEECCWPQRNEFSANEKPCTLRPSKICSPTQGPCCTNDCELKHGDKCLDDNGCRSESFCDGTGPQCPNSDLKPNKTICHDEFVCFKGECTGSICLAYGLESCQCSQGPDDPTTKACELCCKEPGDEKPCLSSFQLNESPWDVPDMFSKPGSPCNNYKGYCDVFQKCRQVDPSGPLATLRKLLLSEESLASLKKFLAQYWYTVIFIILGIFILMALIVRFCGKKTPLVHRKRRHPRSIHHDAVDPEDQTTASTSTSGVAAEEAVQVHPAAVELSLPFGKKVRLGEKKKSSSHKHRTSETVTSPTTSGATTDPLPAAAAAAARATSARVLEGVARATRLAGSLSQRMAQLPSEGTTPLASDENSSPGKERRRSRSIGIIKPKRRPFKSLSPEKRLLAKGLAESVSRSFEKLDLISPRRMAAAGRRRKTVSSADDETAAVVSADPAAVAGRSASAEANAEHRRRKRKERSSRDHSTKPAQGVSKEVATAKLGKFTFSFEVNHGNNKRHRESETEEEKEERRKRREKRKQRRAEHELLPPLQHTQRHRKTSRKTPEENNSGDIKPSTATTDHEQQPSTAATTSAAAKVRRPSLVVVSKRQKSDRPLRSSVSPEKRDDVIGADYRLTFGRKQKPKSAAEMFARSVSHPGPPPSVADIFLAGFEPSSSSVVKSMKRTNSFAGDHRPGKPRLKRSETEKNTGFKRLGKNESGGALLLMPTKPAFENRAYDRSPEPVSSSSKSVDSRPGQRRRGPSLHQSNKASSLDTPSSKKSEFTLDSNDDDSDSSSNSVSKRLTPQTQVHSLSEGSSCGGKGSLGKSNNISITSSDSEMEIIVIGPSVSRSKILERVNKNPETTSQALLLASSLSSISSEDDHPLASSSKPVDGASSNVDYIFPSEELSTTSSSSKSPSLQQTSLSVSSLSERYSRKDSASSTTSSISSKNGGRRRKMSKAKDLSKKTCEDLDNISILTDGMG